MRWRKIEKGKEERGSEEKETVKWKMERQRLEEMIDMNSKIVRSRDLKIIKY